jgi:alpha-L-fucosidase 2
LRARGGFGIESLEWMDGEIVKAVIKSNLGGNCRIRSYSELTTEGGEELTVASGDNKNLFYQTPVVKTPVISEKAELKGFEVKNTFLYDIETEAGQTIILTRKL